MRYRTFSHLAGMAVAAPVFFCTITVSSPAQRDVTRSQAIATADAAWEAGNHSKALTGYRAVVREDTTGASHAVFRLATLLSWNNSLDESITLFGVYRRLEPSDIEGRIALARTLAWSSRFDAAITEYDSILSILPTHEPAALGRAQTLAWAGRMDEAERAYAALLAATANEDAAKGVARVAGWRGDLVRAEKLWRGVLEQHPGDPEALTGLAQVQRWAGKPHAAREALRLALDSDSNYADARSQLRWVDAEISPSFESSVTSMNDNDRNRATLYTAAAGFTPPWSGRLTAAGSYRRANLGLLSGESFGARAVALWAPHERTWRLRAEAGATRLSSHEGGISSAPSSTHLAVAASLAVRPIQRLTFGLGVSRLPFDETASLIARGIVTSELNGDYDLTLASRVSLSGGASYAALNGDALAPNRRHSGSSVLRWRMTRAFSLGIGARAFGYDTTTSDGYFAPRRYTLFEASSVVRAGGDLGWGGSAEAGVGRQQIRFGARSVLRDGEAVTFAETTSSRLAQRISASIRYAPSPGFEWRLSGGFANVASPTAVTEAEYRAYSATIGGRIRL
ncbi:MAG: tetratricopeptide repeat protein [Gemmatimonadaceae bacterium]|nr:tetratricopeptide repeat protein [Gemmatimonadaceae bacterium]